MAKRYTHLKQFLEFRGVDLRSSDVLRGRGYASDGTANIRQTSQGGLTCRYGSHIIGPKISGRTHGPYGGLVSFTTTDMAGTQKTELIGWHATTQRLTQGSFTITNSNAAACTVNHFYEEAISGFRFKITRSAVDIVSMNLGVGTESSPVFLSAVETTVDAATNLAMTTPTNASTFPAAFMQILNGKTIAGSGGTLTIYYRYLEDLANDVRVSSSDNVGTEAYRSVSAVVLKNVLYFTSALEPNSTGASRTLNKYDGNRVYKAGLPKPSDEVVFTTVAAGAKTDDVSGAYTISAPAVDLADVNYAYRYVNIDKAGNRVEGAVYKDPLVVGAAAGEVGKVYASGADTGFSVAFNLGFGIVNNVQAAVSTISTNNPNSLQVGDVAFFYDSSQSRYIQRLVTARTVSTITISLASLDSDSTSDTYDDGGVVSVRDAGLITNNARLGVYRALGSNYYFVKDVPNYMVTQTTNFAFYDNMTDAALELREQLIDDEFPHDMPPRNCAHVAVYNGGLVLSGNTEKRSRVSFSDVDGQEYFPSVTHNFDVNGTVTGHKQSGEFLVVGTNNSITVVSGVLSEFNFRPDTIASNIGITSHLSMHEFEEGVLAFSSNVGPYVLFSGRRLEPLGGLTYQDGSNASRLEPYWTRKYDDDADKPVFKRAIAAVLPNDKLYVLFVPVEDPDSPAYATSASKVFVFDYGRKAWWTWTGLNMAGGITVQDDRLHWQSLSTSAGDVISRPYEQLRSEALDEYNFADHDQTIDFKYRAHWESLGEPSLFKRFFRARVSFHETAYLASATVDLNTYIDYGTTQSNDDTLTVLSTTKDLRPKLKAETLRALLVEFAATVRYNPPPPITGYELEASANFRPEMKE